MSKGWRHAIGDVIWSKLTGQRLMVLDQILVGENDHEINPSPYMYKLRTGTYKHIFLYDFEVTELEPSAPKPKEKQEESNED